MASTTLASESPSPNARVDVGVRAVDDERRAERAEMRRDNPPEPARRAGDPGDLAGRAAYADTDMVPSEYRSGRQADASGGVSGVPSRIGYWPQEWLLHGSDSAPRLTLPAAVPITRRVSLSGPHEACAAISRAERPAGPCRPTARSERDWGLSGRRCGGTGGSRRFARGGGARDADQPPLSRSARNRG